ncbi:MAG: hypothetical protein F4238_08765, partial [Gemmatimonadetes bacterium]|nr:hypothetical protein [Gemmatimonadota bacterium]
GGEEGGDPGPADIPMHKYAVQLTVADVRDGGLSGSTLREATTWGKVETARERMVYGEATITLSLLASDAYHRGIWRRREARRLGRLFTGEPHGPESLARRPLAPEPPARQPLGPGPPAHRGLAGGPT